MTAIKSEDEVIKTTAQNDIECGQLVESQEGLHRRVGGRQVQLFAIGGSIGTTLFVAIGGILAVSGPGWLLIAVALQTCFVGLLNNSIAEMCVLMPVPGGFVRLAGKWVDEALGFMSGINFFLYEAVCIPFEITAAVSVLQFWREDISVEAVIAACIFVYGLINVVAVNWYGEVEFWLSSGKVLLIIMLYVFTFVTMVGGNTRNDVYGFRYWSEPGAFNTYRSEGSQGQFEAFLYALFFAALLVVGPEFISVIAGEAERPRDDIKHAFKTMYWRFAIFFIFGALCVGIVIPYNDPTLLSSQGSGSAAASPYVIAMRNFGIGVLPDVTNALLFSSIFSAGNTYVYTASRNLYSLALVGQAPKVLARCTKKGVPLYSLLVTMMFAFLSFLQVSNSGATVLNWLINILTSGGLINYVVICITYLRFYYACKVQGVDRRAFPYYGWGQPYCAWIAFAEFILITFGIGYTVFLPGQFTVSSFLTKYAMLLITPFTYLGWKWTKGTKIIELAQMDLIWCRPAIDSYELTLPEKPSWRAEVKAYLSRRK